MMPVLRFAPPGPPRAALAVGPRPDPAGGAGRPRLLVTIVDIARVPGPGLRRGYSAGPGGATPQDPPACQPLGPASWPSRLARPSAGFLSRAAIRSGRQAGRRGWHGGVSPPAPGGPHSQRYRARAAGGAAFLRLGGAVFPFVTPPRTP